MTCSISELVSREVPQPRCYCNCYFNRLQGAALHLLYPGFYIAASHAGFRLLHRCLHEIGSGSCVEPCTTRHQRGSRGTMSRRKHAREIGDLCKQVGGTPFPVKQSSWKNLREHCILVSEVFLGVSCVFLFCDCNSWSWWFRSSLHIEERPSYSIRFVVHSTP